MRTKVGVTFQEIINAWFVVMTKFNVAAIIGSSLYMYIHIHMHIISGVIVASL